MIKIEIKEHYEPCPFCGAHDATIEHILSCPADEDPSYFEPELRVFCQCCEAQGPPGRTPDAALGNWNERPKSDRMKIVAIMGGGDWYDASINHLEIPSTISLEEMHKKYRAWYRNEYCPRCRNEERPEYKTFPQFLLEHGAIKTDKVEEYWET